MPRNKTGRVAWIRTVPPEEATGRLKRIYEASEKRAGGVAHVLRVQSLTPGALDAGVRLYQALMLEPGPLSRADRELIATAVSQSNDCFY